jgi:hypothetical protein
MLCWSRDHDRLMLRCEKNGPVALVMPDLEDGGYCALIIEPGFPSQDGFELYMEAVLWVEAFVVKQLRADATFGPVPELRTPLLEGNHAREDHDGGRMDRHSR